MTLGRCCSCGYDDEEETECSKREDRTHCVCWWEGPDRANDTFRCDHCKREVSVEKGADDEIEELVGPICDDCAVVHPLWAELEARSL